MKEEACDDYRVNMSADRFGECKCGHPKIDHNIPTKAVMHVRKIMNTLNVAPLSEKAGVCDNYSMNMAAARFGECSCGFLKADHHHNSAAPVSRMLAKPVSLAATQSVEPGENQVSSRLRLAGQLRISAFFFRGTICHELKPESFSLESALDIGL